ncbi:MAG: DNA-binding response regulator [Acidobacteria bacterium]|nr:DNA-binding response regulator [Acidobacteriota bacterium]
MKQIRVLVAGHYAIIRSGIRSVLEKLPDLQIVAEADDGAEALELIRQHQPAVALIENAMSRLNGFEVTARISRESPDVRVIILSQHADGECLREALCCGAAGYLTMNASASELELAIRTVANGKTHISFSATEPLMNFVRPTNEAFEPLTPRQREVLQLTAEGISTKQIALRLNISVKTVETHRRLLMKRLGIHHTPGLVHYAIKVGLIRLED